MPSIGEAEVVKPSVRMRGVDVSRCPRAIASVKPSTRVRDRTD
jgi:hypothetical protein